MTPDDNLSGFNHLSQSAGDLPVTFQHAATLRQLRLSRRRALQIGGLGMLGLTMQHFLPAGITSSGLLTPGTARAMEPLPARKPTAKSVVFLFQWGGPTQFETFDMKPDAPDGIRGQFRPMSSVVPGMPVCDKLPNMAKIMDQVTLIKSMTHTMKNHNSAAYYALTGKAPPVDDIRLRDTIELFPAYGSIVDHLSPNAPGVPTFAALPHVISDGSVSPGQHASFLGKRHDPLLVTEDPNGADFRLPELSLPSDVSVERLRDRRALQALIDDQLRLREQSTAAKNMDETYAKALALITNDAVKRAFDLSSESAAMRDRYGRTTYGQSLLLARRLVQAGVKFINVYFAQGIGGQSTKEGGWDTHGFNNTHMYPIIEKFHLPLLDQTLPVFLTDLREQGLLDDTLVVWVGEFGRTPKLNGQASRDHWPQCYTALLAGGGTKRGFVYGSSDKDGAYPASDPVRPDDLAATMFAALGLSPETEVRDAQQRPLAIAGRVVEEVFA
ncbi:MAG: DUF1501 domain-containing protein [Pirellulales bacterium]|nr:DUF1501 domain-containing protein [Pirellulales bacterium]